MTDSRVPHRRYGLMSMSRDRVTTVTNSGQSARIETTHICTETLPPVGDTSSGKPPLDCHPEICSDFAHCSLEQTGDAATLAGCGRRTSSCGSSKPASGVSIRVDACAAASRVPYGRRNFRNGSRAAVSIMSGSVRSASHSRLIDRTTPFNTMMCSTLAALWSCSAS